MTSDRRARTGKSRDTVRDGRIKAADEAARGKAAQHIPPPARNQFIGVQLKPGLRYRLPATAASARVAVSGRDLLLAFEGGGRLQLHDLITIETMANAPVFELEERDLLASVIGVLILAHGDGATLGDLVKLSSEVLALSGDSYCDALRALMRDGTLPDSCFRRLDAPSWKPETQPPQAFYSDSS